MIASTYEIIEKLGSGGGGTVYLARHLRLKKKVVLKADKRKLSVDQKLLRREVDILKDLSHPHIPKVYDFFVEGEEVYTVMDYIEGESLDKALKRGETFSQPQVIRWANQLLDTAITSTAQSMEIRREDSCTVISNRRISCGPYKAAFV